MYEQAVNPMPSFASRKTEARLIPPQSYMLEWRDLRARSLGGASELPVGPLLAVSAKEQGARGIFTTAGRTEINGSSERAFYKQCCKSSGRAGQSHD